MRSLHHVAIEASDVPATVRWYVEQLDCDVEYQDATWALLRFSNIRLALVQPGAHPPHLGVAMKAASRFGALQTHRDGTASVYVSDPSGNQVEIIDAATLPAGD